MSWHLSLLHAAECALLVGQHECAGRLLAAETAEEGNDAAERAERAAQSVVGAARAMLRRGCGASDVRLLAEAAEQARRAALGARVECLLAITRQAN